MASKDDRCANVLNKVLGPNWRVLRWWRVTVSSNRRNSVGSFPREEFWFPDGNTAERFAAKAKTKYPHRQVHCLPEYVLTANGGKTACELGIAQKPRKTSTLPQIGKYWDFDG